MTSEERLTLLAKGALVFDGNNQADLLRGIISALTKEEIGEATRLLGEAQDAGNSCAQDVWDTLWKQWGRVDPAGCLALFDEFPDSKSRSDARHLMEGWLEVDPAAALAWAKESRQTRLDAGAAAMALTWEANGDPERLQSSLVDLPADSATVKDALNDYFDLASLAQEHPDAAAIYDGIHPSLKDQAWEITVRRLGYTDPKAAMEWLSEHAGDSGQNYAAIGRLVFEQATQEPAATVRWAVSLPPPLREGVSHPAFHAIPVWLTSDPTEAKAWIASLPPDSPWARFGDRREE